MVATGFSPVAIGALVVYSVAILSGCTRLAFRYQRAQLYWDDFWAFIALFCALILVGVLVSVSVVDLDTITLRAQSFLRWSLYPLNSIAVWSSRLSIGITVLRILPPGSPRTVTLVGNYVMVVMWMGILFENIFFCGTPVPFLPTCETAESTFPIAGITINFLASAFLVCWPAYILISHRWRLVRVNKLTVPSAHHHILLACFSTSILLFAADLVHYLSFLQPHIQYRRMTGHIEAGVSVFLCNLLVLATSIYRLFMGISNRPTNGSSDVNLSTLRGQNTNSNVQKVHIVQETHTFTVVSGPDGRMSIMAPRGDLGLAHVLQKADDDSLTTSDRAVKESDQDEKSDSAVFTAV